MNYEESDAWRPALKGWSRDILPFYERVARELPRGAQCVEIGTAWGRSITFLAQQMLRQSKTVGTRLWGIDPHPISWREGWSHEALSCYAMNVSPIEASLIHMVRATSLEASAMFEPFSLDFVFVDGLHDEASVLQDITLWLPKVKIGGLIAGHDYGRFELKEGISDHPGVKKAVDYMFGASIQVEGSVWSWRNGV